MNTLNHVVNVSNFVELRNEAHRLGLVLGDNLIATIRFSFRVENDTKDTQHGCTFDIKASDEADSDNCRLVGIEKLGIGLGICNDTSMRTLYPDVSLTDVIGNVVSNLKIDTTTPIEVKTFEVSFHGNDKIDPFFKGNFVVFSMAAGQSVICHNDEETLVTK